jgi:hypothetical protein
MGELPALTEAAETAMHEPVLARREAPLQDVAARSKEGELDRLAHGFGLDSPGCAAPPARWPVASYQQLESNAVPFRHAGEAWQRVRVDQARRQMGHEVEPAWLGPAQKSGEQTFGGGADAGEATSRREQPVEWLWPQLRAGLLCRTFLHARLGFR